MKKQTAVEELHSKSSELIMSFLNKEILERDLLIRHHNLFDKAKKIEQSQQQKMIEQMQLFEQLEVMLESGNSINPDSVIRSAIQLIIGK